MDIESGWCLFSADFSMQASGKRKTGSVRFIRDIENRKKWHKLDDDLKETDDCPELYVCGEGETIEDAIINANLSAAHAKAIDCD